MKLSALLATTYALAVAARPSPVFRRDAGFTLQNGLDAIALNTKFKSLTIKSPCTAGEDACLNGTTFAQCVNGAFVASAPCPGVCAALPLVNSAGTSVTCTTEADLEARLAATGATTPNATATLSTSALPSPSASSGGSSANGTKPEDPSQSSLTLLDSVIASGFKNNGQDQPTAGQVASLTSSNNFINFCATVPNLPITNGQQVKAGSCNPAPMGIIAATTNMPSVKFQAPPNLATLPANTTFTIKLAVKHLTTGFFTNAAENYFAAPQQVDKTGDIIGHAHIVIEKLTALNQTTPTDPNKFAFFKGVNDAAVGGVLQVNVTAGLDAGVYRAATIVSSANHQPALVSVAQHGTLDDMIYFTVKAKP